MKKFASIILCASAVLGLGGCASKPIRQPASAVNPAPSELFSNFTRFELKPVAVDADAAKVGANMAAAQKIQDAVEFYMDKAVADWNAAGAARGGAARTLVISPLVEEINFVTKRARFWSGKMKGASEVLLRVTCVEAESGRQVGAAEFYASTDAVRGSQTYGSADDAMLARAANLLADYLLKNYDGSAEIPTRE